MANETASVPTILTTSLFELATFRLGGLTQRATAETYRQ